MHAHTHVLCVDSRQWHDKFDMFFQFRRDGIFLCTMDPTIHGFHLVCGHICVYLCGEQRFDGGDGEGDTDEGRLTRDLVRTYTTPHDTKMRNPNNMVLNPRMTCMHACSHCAMRHTSLFQRLLDRIHGNRIDSECFDLFMCEMFSVCCVFGIGYSQQRLLDDVRVDTGDGEGQCDLNQHTNTSMRHTHRNPNHAHVTCISSHTCHVSTHMLIRRRLMICHPLALLSPCMMCTAMVVVCGCEYGGESECDEEEGEETHDGLERSRCA